MEACNYLMHTSCSARDPSITFGSVIGAPCCIIFGGARLGLMLVNVLRASMRIRCFTFSVLVERLSEMRTWLRGEQ